LTGTFLARSTGAIPAAAAGDAPIPQFLGWDGEPFADGLNHFLVRINQSTSETQDGWLQLSRDDLLVAVASAPTSGGIAVDELEAAVAGSAASQALGTAEVVAALGRRDDVATVRAIGFGAYAVAGSLAMADLAAIPGVGNVTVDAGLTAATVDPYYPSQWGLENDGANLNSWTAAADADIDAPEGWHRTRGAGVVVAVIDSGIDIAHPDLATNVWRNPAEQCGNGIDDDNNGYVDDCVGWDFANNDNTVEDLVGHGTHVAGIIAAEADNGIGVAGVAYESNVMALKIGDGAPALSAALEALAYAIDNGARVINASWLIADPAAAPYLDLALDAAERAGVLVVTGAGNQPVDIDTSPVFPASSAFANVIAVGASTATDQPAAFSGYGSNTVDLFAPGEFVISTVPGGYGVYSGTSMAAPMVSGAAALLWAATPQATYDEVKGALLDRSDGPNDGLTAFRDLASSEGRLNIERSIYTRLFQPSLMYTFHEFNSFEPAAPHQVAIVAKTVDPWIGPPQTPAMYRAGLYVPVDGRPMAVVGHEITYTGNGGDLTVATDATGRALVGQVFERQQRPAFVQDGDFTPLAMELPAGTYAFVMEVVDMTEPEAPVTMGDPSAVFFIVNEDGSVAEMPELPIGDAASPTTSAAPTSSPTSAAPVPTTSPSTAPAVTTSTTDAAQLVTTTTTANSPTPTTAPVATTNPPASTTQPPETTATTAAPSTTLPTVTTPAPPTTTVPPTTNPTTTAAPTTTEPPLDQLRIVDIDPDEGPTSGGILVTITGRNLPELVDIYFAERRAQLVSVMAPTFVVVDLPPGTPGSVDVRLVDRTTGEEAILPDGFTYRAADTGPTPTTTAAPGPATTTTVGVTTTTPTATTSPVFLPSTSLPPSTSVAPPTTAPLPDGDSLQNWLDSVLRTPQGLTLAEPAADDRMAQLPVELWAGAVCNEPVCPGWVLED
jgi:subtilisin family serine protease